MAILLFPSLLLFLALIPLLLLYLYVGFTSSTTTHGPPTHPLIGCLLSFYKNRRRLLDWYTDLLSESPSQTIVIRRLGARRTIVTANPANVEHILKTNFHNYPKGKPFTDILGDLLGRGIFNVDGDLWQSQRKLASHQFTARSLRDSVMTTVDDEAQRRLLPILDLACDGGAVVDLQDLLRRFSFDVVWKVTFGTDPGCLDSSLPVSALARAFDVASEISARRAAAPVFAIWKAKKALGLGSERRLMEEVRLIRETVMELICRRGDEQGEESVQRMDFLSRLMAYDLEVNMIIDMVISFVMAGKDTTSSALTWFFWLLSHHRDVEKEVVEEVENGVSCDDQSIKLKTNYYYKWKEMRMVKASLCESMRLYPPVAWDSKHAVESDTLPDGTSVRKGDRVTYFPYGMGRMEGVWGKDCLEFRPRRWWSAVAEEEDAGVSAYKFPVFQAGPRVCLGKEMAFMQMKYLAAAVLRRYELQPVESGHPVFVPLLTAHMANGFKVHVRRRKTETCKLS